MITTDEDKNKPLPPSRNRFIIFIALFSLAALAVLGRYAYLIFSPPKAEQVNPPRAFAERGSIMDRGGRVLALQTRLGNISVWRPDITDIEALSRDLAPILELSPEEIQAKIQFSTTEFIYLKKQVDQSTVREIESARSGGNLRGVGIESVVGRVYPEKRLAGPIIGVLGDDGIGLEGIEYAFEEDLTSKGDQNGNHVILTIDTNVQFILENIARRTYTDHNADAVMLLAMDPRTGDVLGSASIPDFDPNAFRDSPQEDRIHRPTIMDYEPGSVFKVFSLAALLDSEAIGSNTIFTCNGFYERVTNRGERIRINCLSAHGPVTAREIIIHSCNAGVAYAADRLAVDPFYRRIRDFGFGERTNAGTPGETAGFLRQENLWSERSKPTIAMGQEISVSAMQMLQAATAIANDGILVPPRIVSRVVDPSGKTLRSYETAPPRRILKAETARALRSYMVDVTSEIGTGWRAKLGDLAMAVKTGTAQIADSGTGAYSDTRFLASCIALLPAESPSLVLYLVIVNPQGEILGGRIAAPIIGEAADALVDYLGIPRGRNPQVTHSGEVPIPPGDIPQVGSRVPDFSGYSKRQLLPLLFRDDLRIEISGDGWVRRQSPEPGTMVDADTVIVLELE